MYNKEILIYSFEKMMKIPWIQPSDDSQLVKRVQNGDGYAFEQLYLRYKQPIYNYCWTLLNYNTQDAISVTSDVFIKIYEYLKNHQVENIKALLYTTAHNESLNLIASHRGERRDQFTELFEETVEDNEDKNEKHLLELSFKQEILQDLLKHLDEQSREILYLVYYEEKSYEEIAELLHLKKNTVGTLLSRAKKKLQELASQYHHQKALLS